MMALKNKNIKYFSISTHDENWGIVVTTIGRQLIPPNSSYPLSQHPKSHIFDPTYGRILKEYQIIYISNGTGYFESHSCKRQKINPGTMILLFPNEWHTYEPDKNCGWFEYWVGFKGQYINNCVKNGFFTPKKPIFNLGINSEIIGLFEDIINHASTEKPGYQQLISSIVFYILGLIRYISRNETFNDSYAVLKINEARVIMKQNIEESISPKKIAQELGVSYSWFRKMFKKYVDVSPAQYQSNLRFLRAKELLNTDNLTISDIAFKLNFENVGKFSTFFHKREGIPPSKYRDELRNFK